MSEIALGSGGDASRVLDPRVVYRAKRTSRGSEAARAVEQRAFWGRPFLPDIPTGKSGCGHGAPASVQPPYLRTRRSTGRTNRGYVMQRIASGSWGEAVRGTPLRDSATVRNVTTRGVAAVVVTAAVDVHAAAVAAAVRASALIGSAGRRLRRLGLGDIYSRNGRCR